MAQHGLRNSLLLAPMPTASTAQILGNNESVEPFTRYDERSGSGGRGGRGQGRGVGWGEGGRGGGGAEGRDGERGIEVWGTEGVEVVVPFPAYEGRQTEKERGRDGERQ